MSASLLNRWPSEIPGEALAPSSADIQAIEAVIESCRFHGEGTSEDQIWLELPIPVLKAAQDPDIRYLRGLVTDGRFPSTCITGGSPSHMPWQSALNCAIERELPAHARLLVETGAQVDGFPLWCFARAASRFVRGRPQHFALAALDQFPEIGQMLSSASSVTTMGAALSSQLQFGLTPDELLSRRATRSRFWAESDFPRLDFPAESPSSSLVAAVRARDIEMYEFLTVHGADESGWRQQIPRLEEPFSASMLAVQSPLHVSVANQDMPMLKFLLEDRQHRPDIFSISTPTRGLSPVMLSIARSVPWRRGLTLMLPKSDIELCTPVFGVHLLHLAVATLDISLVGEIQAARAADAHADMHVAPTALGHSALLIACLPLDDTCVIMAAEAIATSAREFRTLAAEWKMQGFHPRYGRWHSSIRGPRGRGVRNYPSGRSEVPSRAGRLPSLAEEAKRQATMIMFLLESVVDAKRELAKQDLHSNTPLHYLAMMRDVDLYVDLICGVIAVARGGSSGGGVKVHQDDLLSSPCLSSEVESSTVDVWTGSENFWGYTPQRLYRSNVEAGNGQGEDYNMIPFWQDERRLR